MRLLNQDVVSEEEFQDFKDADIASAEARLDALENLAILSTEAIFKLRRTMYILIALVCVTLPISIVAVFF